MQKSMKITAALAAALVLSSTAPAFGKITTRSSQALPALAKVPARAAVSRFGQPAVAPVAATSFVQPVAAPALSQSLSPAAVNQSRGRLPGFAWGNPQRLSVLFAFLPPVVQQVIANALDNAGPRGDQLCVVLGIPGCQLPDSTG